MKWAIPVYLGNNDKNLGENPKLGEISVFYAVILLLHVQSQNGLTAQKMKFSIKDFFSVTKSAVSCGFGYIYWINL